MLFHHLHYHYLEYDRKNFVRYPTKDQVHFVVQWYNLDYLDHLKTKEIMKTFCFLVFKFTLPLISLTGKPTKDGRFRVRAG